MSDIPPDARRAAAILRRDAELDPAARARLLALALAAATAATAPRASAPAPAPRATWTWLTALGLAALVVVAGGLWRRARDLPPTAPTTARVSPRPAPAAPPPATTPPPVAVAPPAPIAPTPIAPPTPAAAPRVTPRTHARASAAPPPAAPVALRPPADTAPARAATLEEELRAVRAARSANDRSAPSDALRALDDAPSLRLVWAEGAAERVVALCALGRHAEASSLGAEVLRRSPAGASAARVRRSCGGSPAR